MLQVTYSLFYKLKPSGATSFLGDQLLQEHSLECHSL